MSYDLILPGFTSSFKTFVSKYYDIKIIDDVIETFEMDVVSTRPKSTDWTIHLTTVRQRCGREFRLRRKLD